MKSYLNPRPDSPLGEKVGERSDREVIWRGESKGILPRFLPFSHTTEPGPRLKPGATNDGFLPNALKTLF